MGRRKLYDSPAEMQKAYRQRVERERWALADEVDRLRRRLDAQGDHEAAELLSRVQGALHNGRPRKSDPVRSGKPTRTRNSRGGETVTLREAVTRAATTERQEQPPKVTAAASVPTEYIQLMPTDHKRTGISQVQAALLAHLDQGARLYRTSLAGGYVIVQADGTEKATHSGAVNALKKSGLLR